MAPALGCVGENSPEHGDDVIPADSHHCGKYKGPDSSLQSLHPLQEENVPGQNQDRHLHPFLLLALETTQALKKTLRYMSQNTEGQALLKIQFTVAVLSHLPAITQILESCRHCGFGILAIVSSER